MEGTWLNISKRFCYYDSILDDTNSGLLVKELCNITRWNRISMQKDIEEIVSNGVVQVNQQAFDRVIFKDKIEKKSFHNFISSKLNDSERRCNYNSGNALG